MDPFNSCVKRTQGKRADLEELLFKRNANDRDTEKRAGNKVRQCKLQSGNQKPQDIQKKRNGRIIVVDDFLSKWIQRDAAELETLHPDRNSDNGDTPQYSCQNPENGTDQTAKDELQNIQYDSHCNAPLPS